MPSSAPFVFANDRWILESRTALVNMGEDNVVAAEGVRCIDALRKKINDVLPEGVDLAAPVVDVGPGPHPIPYMGGTISFGKKDRADDRSSGQLPTPTGSDPSPPSHSPEPVLASAPYLASSLSNDFFIPPEPLLAGPLPSLFDLPPPMPTGDDAPPLATLSIAAGAFDSSLGGAATLDMTPREDWMDFESSPVVSWPVGAAALQGGNEWDTLWQQIQDLQGGQQQMGL